MRTFLIIILFPFTFLAQEVEIKHLSDNINSLGAELNFIQITDSLAYFTVVSDDEGVLESSIYKSILKADEWGKKRYSKYNSDIYNTANLNSSIKEFSFFTIGNKETLDCKIVFFDHKKNNGYKVIDAIIKEGFINTQPHLTRHKNQKALYFVSDRNGGFGGLDIWVSIMDDKGSFGMPINAGNKINSPYDEITPFYNNHDGKLYFSSNRNQEKKGFDIFKSEGNLNLWKIPTNVKELNTKQDEMYLTFYSKNKGYFSSNRKEAKYLSDQYCCNDIFSFEYPKKEQDSIVLLQKTHEYLPLSLYFHNDEPDCCTMKTTTDKTYKDSYIDYFQMKDEYMIQNPNNESFFTNELQESYNKLSKVFELLIADLNNGHKIELQVKGFASPLHNTEYNKNLSQRRISSLINYLSQYRAGIFADFIAAKQLTITELSFGESQSSEKVSDNPNDKKKSIYSIDAMRERKIQIIDVILKD